MSIVHTKLELYIGTPRMSRTLKMREIRDVPIACKGNSQLFRNFARCIVIKRARLRAELYPSRSHFMSLTDVDFRLSYLACLQKFV